MSKGETKRAHPQKKVIGLSALHKDLTHTESTPHIWSYWSYYNLNIPTHGEQDLQRKSFSKKKTGALFVVRRTQQPEGPFPKVLIE